MDSSFNPSLNEISANIQHIIIIDPKLVWIILLVTWIIFTLFSAVLFYHWFTYSYTPKTTSRVIKIYLLGSGVFVAGGIISALSYTFSI